MRSPGHRTRGQRSPRSAVALASLLAIGLVIATGCQTSGSVGDDRAEVEATDPSTTTGSAGTDRVEETTMTEPTDREGSSPADAFVVRERERGERILRDLVSDAPGLLAGSDELELAIGPAAEDRSDREVLVLTVPAAPLGGPDGFFVLTVVPGGPGPLVIRRAAISEEGTTVLIEARSGPTVEGRWGFGLAPRMRPAVASGDDPADGIETSVVQAAVFDVEPVVPPESDLGDGWRRLGFEVPSWLIDRAPTAAACEQVVERLDADLGSGEPRWPEDTLGEAALERAAAAVERQDQDRGRRIELTLEIGDREIVRGTRLQPQARFPVTVIAADGTGRAASLGCTVTAP